MIENRGNAPWDVFLTDEFVALHGPYCCVYAAWEKWMKEQEGEILESIEGFDATTKTSLYIAMEKACDYAATSGKVDPDENVRRVYEDDFIHKDGNPTHGPSPLRAAFTAFKLGEEMKEAVRQHSINHAPG